MLIKNLYMLRIRILVSSILSPLLMVGDVLLQEGNILLQNYPIFAFECCMQNNLIVVICLSVIPICQLSTFVLMINEKVTVGSYFMRKIVIFDSHAMSK